MTDLTIIRGKSPVALVKAVGEDGKAIADVDVYAYYLSSHLRVTTTRQADGRLRVAPIDLDEKVNVMVSSPGYKSVSETLGLLEGEVKQLNVTLKPLVAAESDEPGKAAANLAEKHRPLPRNLRRLIRQCQGVQGSQKRPNQAPKLRKRPPPNPLMNRQPQAANPRGRKHPRPNRCFPPLAA